ncbi:MAG TPA: hypothetical protein PL029_05460 [Bacteroidia bacterium]|nr:hypothetical protein [Bacteroidia bacterium]
MRKLNTLIFLCISLCCFSQKPGQRNALMTIRGNIGIPQVISSKMFRTSFAGIYEGNLSVNFRLFDNFYMGAGYQNTQFQNNKFLKMQLFNASVSYNTRLMCNGMFIKLGYDQFFSEKGYFSYSINTGYMLSVYNNVNADTSARNQPFVGKKFNAPYVQPEVSVNFGVEDNMSFSLMVSYTTLFHKYVARAPRFNQFEEIRKARNNYVMGWLAFGVGFNVLRNRK